MHKSHYGKKEERKPIEKIEPEYSPKIISTQEAYKRIHGIINKERQTQLNDIAEKIFNLSKIANNKGLNIEYRKQAKENAEKILNKYDLTDDDRKEILKLVKKIQSKNDREK